MPRHSRRRPRAAARSDRRRPRARGLAGSSPVAGAPTTQYDVFSVEPAAGRRHRRVQSLALRESTAQHGGDRRVLPLVAMLRLADLNGNFVVPRRVRAGRLRRSACASPWLARHPRTFFWLQPIVDLAAITFGIGSPRAARHAALPARPTPSSRSSRRACCRFCRSACRRRCCRRRAWPPARLRARLDARDAGQLRLSRRRSCSSSWHSSRSSTARTCAREERQASGSRAEPRGEPGAAFAEEGRLAAGIAEIARTLGASLDDPEPLSRVVGTIRDRPWADWCALLRRRRRGFRLLAVCEPEERRQQRDRDRSADRHVAGDRAGCATRARSRSAAASSADADVAQRTRALRSTLLTGPTATRR